MLKSIWIMAACLVAAGCQQKSAFDGRSVPSFSIAEVEVAPPSANDFWWAEREDGAFAPTNCPKESLASSNTPIAYDSTTSITSCRERETLPPDAKSAERAEYAALVERDLRSRLVPRFSGERSATLRVTLTNLSTASTGQTLLVGGGSSLTGIATLVDPATGETLARSETLTAASGGAGGLIGVALEANQPDPALRLSSAFALETCAWLKGDRTDCGL